MLQTLSRYSNPFEDRMNKTAIDSIDKSKSTQAEMMVKHIQITMTIVFSMVLSRLEKRQGVLRCHKYAYRLSKQMRARNISSIP